MPQTQTAKDLSNPEIDKSMPSQPPTLDLVTKCLQFFKNNKKIFDWITYENLYLANVDLYLHKDIFSIYKLT